MFCGVAGPAISFPMGDNGQSRVTPKGTFPIPRKNNIHAIPVYFRSIPKRLYNSMRTLLDFTTTHDVHTVVVCFAFHHRSIIKVVLHGIDHL